MKHQCAKRLPQQQEQQEQQQEQQHLQREIISGTPTRPEFGLVERKFATIIGVYKDDGIFIHTGLLQPVHNRCHTVVQRSEHR